MFNITSTLAWVRSTTMSVSVCLFVRVFVCPLADLENHKADLHHFFCMFSVAVAWFPVRPAISYVLPVLWMTLCFSIPMGQNQARRYV